MTASTRTAGDYERLRAAVLSTELARGPDVGAVHQRGLARWLKEPAVNPVAQHSDVGQDRTPDAIVAPASATIELSRLIAGIVVALAAEPAHG